MSPYAKSLGAQPALLTKRELFAAMAMQGILGNEAISRGLFERAARQPGAEGKTMGAAVAEAAIGYGDSLLAELVKDQP